MKVAIIGAGLIGKKRGVVVKNSKTDKVTWIIDVDLKKANELAAMVGGQTSVDWRKAIKDKDVELVIIATTHDWLTKISEEALKAGKHVLCEKPLGIEFEDIKKCVNLAERKKLIYKAGYNHRFHPAIWKAFGLFKRGEIGELMYIKADYGHGGRPGYEKEWRMKKSVSGGGELIDQGAHLLDLANWFMEGVDEIQSVLTTSFWPVTVEDNVFVTLKNKNEVAMIHAGWTEWKNKFVFEVYGKKGFLKINGLGGSYGLESLTLGKRVPGKAPKEKVWNYEGEDISWTNEWKNIKHSLKNISLLSGSGRDGLEVINLVKTIYKQK